MINFFSDLGVRVFWITAAISSVLLLVFWKKLRQMIFSTRKSQPPEYVLQKGFLPRFFDYLFQKEILVTVLIIFFINLLKSLNFSWLLLQTEVLFVIQFCYNMFITELSEMFGIFLILNLKQNNMTSLVLKNNLSKIGQGIVLVFISVLVKTVLIAFIFPSLIYTIAVIPLYIIYFTRDFSCQETIEETFRITKGNKLDIFLNAIVLVILGIILDVALQFLMKMRIIRLEDGLENLENIIASSKYLQYFLGVVDATIKIAFVLAFSLTTYDKLVPKEKKEETPEDLKVNDETEIIQSALDTKGNF